MNFFVEEEESMSVKDKYVCNLVGDAIWHEPLEDVLLSDEKFVEELDNFPGLLMSEKFEGKTLDEMKEFLHGCVIGNTSRTYVLNVLALKHLFRLVKQEDQNLLDSFWKQRLDLYFDDGAQKQNARKNIKGGERK